MNILFILQNIFIIHDYTNDIGQKFYDDLSADVSLLKEFFEYCLDVYFIRVLLIFIYVHKK